MFLLSPPSFFANSTRRTLESRYVPAPIHRLFRRISRPWPLRRRHVAKIEADADHAQHQAELNLRIIAALGLECRGLRILEIGPGHHFGPALLLASQGAHVTLADRFLASWDDPYHPAFHRALRAGWNGPAAALDSVIARGSYDGWLTLLAEPAEHLVSLTASSVDLVLSYSVLEHVFDLPAVCAELARITPTGGFNCHHVDFRWHRFGWRQPLEFLVHSEDRFRRDFAAEHGECGNRWRPSEVAALFQSAGFEVVRIVPDLFTAPTELARVLPRLRRSASPYRNWPEEDLRTLSAYFQLKRTDDPSVREHGAAQLEIHRKLKAVCV